MLAALGASAPSLRVSPASLACEASLTSLSAAEPTRPTPRGLQGIRRAVPGSVRLASGQLYTLAVGSDETTLLFDSIRALATNPPA